MTDIHRLDGKNCERRVLWSYNRKDDYAKVNKNIIWVIDGNNYGENQSIVVTELKHSNRIFLEFKIEYFFIYVFVYKSYQTSKYLDKGIIYKI